MNRERIRVSVVVALFAAAFTATAVTTAAVADAGSSPAGLDTLSPDPPSCPDDPDFDFAVTDPQGDGRGFPADPRDILSLRGFGDSQTLCLEMTFSESLDPALTDAPNYLSIGFDTDEDASTGGMFGRWIIGRGSNLYIRYLCEDPAFIGADAIFQLRNLTLSSNGNATPVPTAFDGPRVTVEIPMNAIGSDPAMNLEIMLGGHSPSSGYDASDCMFDGASIHSPNGTAVPPSDRDADGVFDAVDACPDAPDPGQPDADGDDIGDACDPSPTHDFEILRFRGHGATLRATAGAGEMRADLTVANVYPWESQITIDGGSLQGLPPGCEPRSAPYMTTPLGPLERKRIKLTHDVSCRPDTPAGDYLVTFEVSTYYRTSDGGFVTFDIATDTATLRVR